MSESKKVFEARITLGELLAVMAMLGGILAFGLKYEARVVALEVNQREQAKRLDKIELAIEKTAENHRLLVDMLQRRGP